MDAPLLTALLAAIELSPDNPHLLDAFVRVCHAQGAAEAAVGVLASRSPAVLARQPRHLAAELFARNGAAEQALRWADGPQPEDRIARARVLLALDRPDEARDLYTAAVAEDPTVEDPTLAANLAPTARHVRTVGGPTLTLFGRHDPPPAPPADDLPTFADVAGHEALKQALRARVSAPSRLPSLFQRFRRSDPGGLLLYGPPGCGKTLAATALAGELRLPLVQVRVDLVLDAWLGESEARLHDLFQEARDRAPSVLLIDGLESVGGTRQQATGDRALFAQLLAELDQTEGSNQHVTILATTHLPWVIDAALRRTGRLERAMFVPPPTRNERAAILQLHLRDRPTSPTLDLDGLARRTSGFSGADLAQLAEHAADLAIEASVTARREVPIGDAHLGAAADQLTPTTLEWLTTARNHARYADGAHQYREVIEFLDRHGRK